MNPSSITASQRRLGASDLHVSPVAFGGWPISGVTSLDVNDADSLATIRACQELGINFIDTAYCYGQRGESEQLIREAIASQRDQFVLATKGGIHFQSDGSQAQDASPETLLRECDESLQRLGTDRIDLYYLHAPDPEVPVTDSAGAIKSLIDAGKVRYAGASNCNLELLKQFHAVCPLTAVQLPYNMLQREIEQQTLPWCQERQIGLAVYWPLMKGLLAGRLTRLDQLDEADKRRSYPMYQGEEWEKNQQLLDKLRQIASDCDRTVAQLVVNWTIEQPGITVALCGAKRRWQLEETASAMGWELTDAQRSAIAEALAQRGPAVTKRLFT